MPGYGNYCGPYWSAGKNQSSVVDPLVPSVDEFDETCRVHDAAYARGEDLDIADSLFVRHNWGKGWLRSSAAAAVWFYNRTGHFGMGSKSFVLGDMPKRSRTSLSRSFAPAAVGTGIRLSEPQVTHMKDGCTVSGSELVSVTLPAYDTATWNIVSMCRLSPVHFGSGRLGKFAQIYSNFKFQKVSITYVTAVGTSAQGNTIVEYQEDSNEPVRRFGQSDFLTGVMTSGEGLLMPCWENFTVEIPVSDKQWHPMSSDLAYPNQDDQSSGDVIMYQKNSVSNQTVGFFIFNYICDFQGATLNPRAGTQIPYVLTTPNWFYTQIRDCTEATGVSGTQTANYGVVMSEYTSTITGAATIAGGVIYKIVFVYAQSSFPTTTGDNYFNKIGGTTGSTVNMNTSDKNGYTFYGVANGGSSFAAVKIFTTLRGCLAYSIQNASTTDLASGVLDMLCYRATVASTAVWTVWMCPISLAAADQQAN